MTTPLPPEIKKPERPPEPTIQELRHQWIHRGHDKLTEHMEHFTAQSTAWAYVLLLGTGLAGFLTWVSVRVGIQDNLFSPFTVVIWLGSVYIIYRIRTIH